MSELSSSPQTSSVSPSGVLRITQRSAERNAFFPEDGSNRTDVICQISRTFNSYFFLK